MARYRLLTGIHYGRDYDADPTPVLDANGQVWTNPKTGKPELRYPPKKYNQGDIVEDDKIDLVQFGGPDKFAYMDGPPRTEEGGPKVSAAKSFQVAPQGQVLEGHQQATSLPDGRTVSGLAQEKALQLNEEAGQAHAEEKAQKTEAKATERDAARQQAEQGKGQEGDARKGMAPSSPPKGQRPNPSPTTAHKGMGSHAAKGTQQPQSKVDDR